MTTRPSQVAIFENKSAKFDREVTYFRVKKNQNSGSRGRRRESLWLSKSRISLIFYSKITNSNKRLYSTFCLFDWKSLHLILGVNKKKGRAISRILCIGEANPQPEVIHLGALSPKPSSARKRLIAMRGTRIIGSAYACIR